jgi:hypothetical protein
MAEEMQGIMSLSEGQQEPMGQIDPTQFSPVVESYARSNPREFNNDILGGMAQAEPALVDEFIRSLASLNLPAEVLDAIQTMVDGILSDPEDYARNRAEFIKEGVPEELLPLEFDPAFFAALNMALDQLEMSVVQEPEIPRFADGGIINVREIAGEIAKMGRNGDTMLAHITPAEARILRRRGGSGTINPETGLPEFFLKKAFKAVGKVFKGAVKAVTSAVKSVGKVVKKIASSPLGKIAMTAAAVYFMGAAGVAGKLGIQNAALANGVNTFAGSTLVNVASGQKIGDAIRGGLVSGTLAGGATALFDGGVFGGKSAPDPAVPAVDDFATRGVMTPSSVSAQGDFSSQMFPMTSQAAAPAGVFGGNLEQGVNFAGSMPAPSSFAGAGAPTGSLMDSVSQTGANLVNQGRDALSSTKDFLSSAYDRISPSAIQKAGATQAIEAGNAAVSQLPASASDALKASVFDKAYNAALPGVLSTYGPMAATALAGATALGAFKQPELEMPQNIGEFQTTGQDLLRSSPEEYGLSYGGTQTTYAPNPYENLASPGQVQFSRQDDPYANLYSGFQLPPPLRFPFDDSMQGGIGGLEPRRLAKGGTAEFPRKTGPINGPGTGTSDSVPAMLSDGEFVFTAKAVRAMGNGSRRKGAKRMYAMMKQLERKAS